MNAFEFAANHPFLVFFLLLIVCLSAISVTRWIALAVIGRAAIKAGRGLKIE